MIMDLPEEFSIGNAWQKNDAFIEDGILKIRKDAIPKPIIVDKNGFLLDGFYSVIYAKNNLITMLPAIELENVKVIM